MPRGKQPKSTAAKRLELDKQLESPLAGVSVDDLVAAMQPFVSGAIETLGREAAAGNVTAAKTILDFLATIAKDDKGARGLDILRQVAEIRRGNPS